MKKILTISLVVIIVLMFVGCNSESMSEKNLSDDNFSEFDNYGENASSGVYSGSVKTFKNGKIYFLLDEVIFLDGVTSDIVFLNVDDKLAELWNLIDKNNISVNDDGLLLISNNSTIASDLYLSDFYISGNNVFAKLLDIKSVKGNENLEERDYTDSLKIEYVNKFSYFDASSSVEDIFSLDMYSNNPTFKFFVDYLVENDFEIYKDNILNKFVVSAFENGVVSVYDLQAGDMFDGWTVERSEANSDSFGYTLTNDVGYNVSGTFLYDAFNDDYTLLISDLNVPNVKLSYNQNTFNMFEMFAFNLITNDEITFDEHTSDKLYNGEAIKFKGTIKKYSYGGWAYSEAFSSVEFSEFEIIK